MRSPSKVIKLALISLLACGWPFTLTAADLEAKIKAAYIYHLTEFIEWPELPANEFRICIIGADNIARMLQELNGRSVFDRPLKIDNQADSHPDHCQLLYLDHADEGDGELLRVLASKSVLTVSDSENFARHGGGIGFYSESGKLKLEINPQILRAANFRISSKLLELARSAQ